MTRKQIEKLLTKQFRNLETKSKEELIKIILQRELEEIKLSLYLQNNSI